MSPDYLQPIATVLGTFIAAIVGTYFTAMYAVRKLRDELRYGVQKERYARTLDACQGCWKLLAYTTTTENEKSILLFERAKGSQATIWKMSQPNAASFIKELTTFFYSSGAGLFLPKEVRPLLFEYRNILYGVLLSNREKKDDIIIVEKNEMVKKMKDIHTSLISILRAAAGSQSPELPENLE